MCGTNWQICTTEPPTYSEDLLTDNDDLTGLLPLSLPLPALHAGVSSY